MRALIVLLAMSSGLVVLTGPASACSIRGTYCGYPSWAANAFEGRYGFKGDPRILTEYYPGFNNRKAGSTERKPHKRYR